MINRPSGRKVVAPSRKGGVKEGVFPSIFSSPVRGGIIPIAHPARCAGSEKGEGISNHGLTPRGYNIPASVRPFYEESYSKS